MSWRSCGSATGPKRRRSRRAISIDHRAQAAGHQRANRLRLKREHDGDAGRRGSGQSRERYHLAFLHAHPCKRRMGRGPHGQQHRSLDQHDAVTPGVGEQHALGHLFGDAGVARGGHGGTEDERQRGEHQTILTSPQRAAIDWMAEADIIPTDDPRAATGSAGARGDADPEAPNAWSLPPARARRCPIASRHPPRPFEARLAAERLQLTGEQAHGVADAAEP
jgi:hypothetical protein